MLDSSEYDEFEPGMVLDMYQLLPEDYDKHIRGANCEIAYFITSDVSPEERFLIQKNMTQKKITLSINPTRNFARVLNALWSRALL